MQRAPDPPQPANGPRARPGSPSRRALLALLVVFVALHFGLFGVLHEPGHLIIDEVAYHFMTRSLAQGNGLEIWNGYQEFPSPALEIPLTDTIVARGGRLVSKYPSLAPSLAAPLYPFLGFASLLWLNALAFVGVVIATFLTARRFVDGWAAIGACAVLVGATYAWEYSQAAWPHALAMLFTTGGFYCAIRGTHDQGPRSRRTWASAAGLILGVGCGARLDVILVLGAASALLLAHSPPRWRELAWMVLALVPGMLALSFENAYKLGVFWPAVYTSSHGWQRFLPAVGLVAGGAAVRLALSRPTWAEALRPHRRVILFASILVMVVLLLFDPVRAFVARLLWGVATLVVDLSLLDPARREPAMVRSDTGAVLYFGQVKKALLQSCPFFAGTFAALALSRHAAGAQRGLWTLMLVPTVVIVGFSSSTWHGGLGLNLRYFLPTLPFLSILGAYLVQEVGRRASRTWIGGAVLGAITAAATYIYVMWRPPVRETIVEIVVLRAPLWLAGAIVVLSATLLVRREGVRRRLAGPLLVVLAVSLAWSSLTSLSYDYRASRSVRAARHEMSTQLASVVPPDSLLLVTILDPFAGLIDANRVRLANPLQDDFRSFRELVTYHLEQGRGVYFAWSPSDLDEIERAGLLDGFHIQLMPRIGPLAVGRIELARRYPAPSQR